MTQFLDYDGLAELVGQVKAITPEYRAAFIVPAIVGDAGLVSGGADYDEDEENYTYEGGYNADVYGTSFCTLTAPTSLHIDEAGLYRVAAHVEPRALSADDAVLRLDVAEGESTDDLFSSAETVATADAEVGETVYTWTAESASVSSTDATTYPKLAVGLIVTDDVGIYAVLSGCIPNLFSSVSFSIDSEGVVYSIEFSYSGKDLTPSSAEVVDVATAKGSTVVFDVSDEVSESVVYTGEFSLASATVYLDEGDNLILRAIADGENVLWYTTAFSKEDGDYDTVPGSTQSALEYVEPSSFLFVERVALADPTGTVESDYVSLG